MIDRCFFLDKMYFIDPSFSGSHFKIGPVGLKFIFERNNIFRCDKNRIFPNFSYLYFVIKSST